MVLELFSGADHDFIERVASTFTNFNFEMSPETHDDRLRSMAGKPYTNQQLVAAVSAALHPPVLIPEAIQTRENEVAPQSAGKLIFGA